MLGYTSGFDKSMNGVRTLTDGISIIQDGTASHENVIYSDFVKSETNETIILKDTITTEYLNASITSTNDFNATNIDATNIECDYFNVNNVSNILEDTFIVNGNTNNIINNGISTFNNTVNVVNKNLVQTQSGIIQQTGTGTNNFKDSNINGSLVLGSNFTQTGGSSSVKDITTDNITMRTNKGITQTGSTISNSLGTTSITNLVITDSVSFPSTVTIPGTTTTDDILMEGDSVITQDITTSTSKFNKFRYSKFLDIDIDGDINQVKGGATAILKNTTIEGTLDIQGDITQTTGSTILKTINCDNITLNSNNSINQSGTGFINQSGTGTNQMKAINLLSNSNLVFNGTGAIDQPVNGINSMSHTKINGYSIMSGRNNSTNGATQNITNNQGLHLQFGRVSSDGTSYIMNHKGGATGNGAFRFQRYNGSGVYIDEPLNIGDTIQLNKDTDIIGSISASTIGTIGAIDNTEFQKLNGLIIPGTIQDKFNDLDTTINNIQTTTGNNNTALTGITYNSSTDTTLIDNNVSIPSGKNLLLGTTNVLNNINTANTNITNLQTTTSGITYNGTTDTTTIDNNLTINKNLIVQGMNIKDEIDALETSFTTGTISSTNATITNLTSTSINTTDLTALNQVRCPNFSISNNAAAGTTYNSTAITNPVQTHGIGIATGDGGTTFSTFNQAIYSWYGTGFIDTCFKVCNAVINHRTGDFLTNGIITCANLVVNTTATFFKALFNNITVSEFFSASNNELIVYPNKISPSTENVKTLGTGNIVVASLTIQPKFNETLTINTPISLYRRFKNNTASPGTYTIMYDRVLQITCNIYRNNVIFLSTPCICNNTIPQPQLMTIRADTSLSEKWFDLYITNARITFTPSITETIDTYRIEYIITAASSVENSANFVSLDYGFYVNTNSSTFNKSSSDIIFTAGSGGTNYSAYSRLNAFKNDFITNGVSRTYTNNLVSNNLANQGSMSTNSLIVNTSFQTDTITINGPLIGKANKPITSGGTYIGAYFINIALNEYKLDRFNFVPASVAVAGERDDYWIVSAGYKLVLYRFSNYVILEGFRPWSGSTDWDSQTRTLDNTNGTTFISLASIDIYGTSNQVGSCKLYYQNQEITMPYFS